MKIQIKIEVWDDTYDRKGYAECDMVCTGTNLINLVNMSAMLCADVEFQLAKKAKTETEAPADPAPAVTEPEAHAAPL